MFELIDVEYRYGQTLALLPVTRRFEPGKVTVIVGPNGAGKSTVLKLLTGELAPTAGLVFLSSRDVSKCRPHELAQMRAVLPQSTHLSFPFTVHEVAGLGMIASGLDTDRRKRLISDALDQVDLSDFKARLYQQLSGGEQQRVQLARVLCQLQSSSLPPTDRCLLLDEPVSSLDIRHQIATMNIARRHARQGTTVIAVLHDLNLAAQYADQVLVMAGGRVLAEGAPGVALDPDVIEDAFGVRPKILRGAPGEPPIISVFSTSAGTTPLNRPELLH